MENVPPTVTLGAALIVMVTMFSMLAIIHFHNRNAKGRSREMRESAEQGTELYQHLVALELMRVVEEFEAEDREARASSSGLEIDLTSGIDLTSDTEVFHQNEGSEAR